MGEPCSCGGAPEIAWPLTVAQVIGLVALLVAIAFLHDGWYVVGAFGLALLTGRLDGAIHTIRRTRSR
jgi:hypothetical protein